MSITQRFLSEDDETQSIDVPLPLPARTPISRSASKPPDPSLSPSEAARDEHEKSVEHTMPDDPDGDFA
jgi:hypothetical protein